MRLLFLLISMLLALPAAADTLDIIEKRIAGKSDVAQLDVEALAKMMSQPDLVLLDVRAADEFAVSHLPGAIRVDPSLSGARFLAAFADRLEGKQVVFYCSVGRRSTALAERAQAAGLEAAAVYNLRGGIFRWHGRNMPLVDAEGPTDVAHPYNWFWQRVMPRPEASAYHPSARADARAP